MFFWTPFRGTICSLTEKTPFYTVILKYRGVLSPLSDQENNSIPEVERNVAIKIFIKLIRVWGNKDKLSIGAKQLKNKKRILFHKENGITVILRDITQKN